MGDRYSALAVVFGVVSFALGVLVLPAAGQHIQSADATATTVASPVAHTPWGDPDLQGIWTHGTFTPLERPAEYGERELLTAEEVAALNHAGVGRDFTYVSTAGGAFLEWMEGKPLPGVEVLRVR